MKSGVRLTIFLMMKARWRASKGDEERSATFRNLPPRRFRRRSKGDEERSATWLPVLLYSRRLGQKAMKSGVRPAVLNATLVERPRQKAMKSGVRLPVP